MESKPQPTPYIVDGGDCCACVLAGVAGLSVEDIYELQPNGPKAFTRESLLDVCTMLKNRGHIDRIVDHVPIWPPRRPGHALDYGLSAAKQSEQWWKYVRMADDAGYVGVTFVDQAGRGGEVDHAIMIKGSHKDEKKVEISCPVRRDYECGVETFLEDYGGFCAVFVRPAGLSAGRP